MRRLLFFQNISVSAGSLAYEISITDLEHLWIFSNFELSLFYLFPSFALALFASSISSTNRWLVWCFLLLTASIVKVASGGIKVSIHKDWLVVMAEKVPEQLTGLSR
jgi:hypothetical protein